MKWLDRLFGGSRDMAALPAGTKAPDITLPVVLNIKHNAEFSLQTALQQGPVLAAFFKISCPVCQYALPFLERIHQAHGDQKVTIVGISQDSQRDTAAFLKQYAVSFPTLLDDPHSYSVSNAYGLTNVPSLFLIGQDGHIEVSSVGWSRQDLENINRRLADAQKMTHPPIFRPGEDVRDFRAG